MSDELEKINPLESKDIEDLSKSDVKQIKLKGKLLEDQLNQLIDYIENELFEDKI